MPARSDTSSSPEARAWSTDAVPPAERLDYWVGAICEAFLEMDCSSREALHFGGALRSQPADTLTFNQVVASTQDVYRTPQSIARSTRQHFYLITQYETAWHVRQNGEVAHLRPGDAVLVDAAQGYELHFPQGVACLSVQLPRAWVGRWLREPEARALRTVPRDAGWGPALSGLCLQLGRAPELAADMPAPLLCDHLGALLATALEPARPAPAAGPARQLHERACLLMQQLIDQPELHAQPLAAELGVSLRSLHRAFAAQGTTFAGTLRGMRLARAAQLLAQPRLAGIASGEIGRRCGFADPSHFVREFQRAYGRTPAHWRREHRS